MNRRNFLHRAGLAACLAALGGLAALPAAAHHGWGWATDTEFEITGKVTGLRLGNPHGEMTIDVAGKRWTVEIGQPWRNQRAGLTEQLLASGTEVTVHGHRSANPDALLVKAEWLAIAGRKYDLYPDRPS